MNNLSLASLFDLRGKVALVTGAAGGLGASCAQALAAQGAQVIVCDRLRSSCEEQALALRAAGGDALALPADLADLASIPELGRAALAWRCRLDVLVCNAGIQGPHGPLAAVDNTQWQSVMDVNLRSAAVLANAVLPAMATQGTGSVILMSSIAGLRGNKSIGLYGISKAALAQLARNLAVEWGPAGVRVNAVSPGLIRTPLANELLDRPDFMRQRVALTPMRRVGEPHEVAGAVVMLASQAGAFITGHNLVIDGGTTISDGQ
ncbi:MAG: Short-chain reductase protein NovJ [Paracidovorax wautersii]|uniref:Short-chain reductase protein NovJ n=1 Tax=Paracidovorax wautersii TaxID=1177982 RepID=A0A7V8FKG5_9BURK|nr:MAG: Short-chain reductase protein NovJ [Paracidovorax wautersii]